MTNKYSYIGEDDLNDRMYAYDTDMEKYDFNAAAIKQLATALKSGNLASIKELFDVLEDKQKRGLINLHIDYSIVECYYLNLHAPSDLPIALANLFKYPEIATYLTQVKNNLETKLNSEVKDNQTSSPSI